MSKRQNAFFATTLVVVTAVVAMTAPASLAEVTLPTIFSDHMVMQREAELPVWGWADPGDEITVKLGDNEATAKTDADGNWRVDLPAVKTGRPVALTVTGPDNTVKVKDILVGEVWVCSGQSNMDMRVGGCLEAGKEAADAKYPEIRQFGVAKRPGAQHRENVPGDWTLCSPQTVKGFTATGYFFGRKLHKTLDVPIGLIHTSWGGTRIEPWTPIAGFKAVPELADILKQLKNQKAAYRKSLPAKLAEIDKWSEAVRKAIAKDKQLPPQPDWPRHPVYNSGHPNSPTALYNGMVHPLVPYAIRGAIWYQGESNGGEGISYYHKMRALIGGWRKVWNQGDFPFYHVQLANFRSPNDNPAGGDGWAKLREAQRRSLDIPNTGMAVIIDIGMARNIHPKNKQDVGKRLALWALAKDYDKDIVFSGPLYKKMKVEGNKIRISFDCTGGGLIVGKKEGLAPTKEVENGELKHFAIAGADKKWYWADAVIDDDTVVVSCDKVAKPVAVRYGFAMNPESCNLYNKEGLPASPFRTDDW